MNNVYSLRANGKESNDKGETSKGGKAEWNSELNEKVLVNL